ncbi:MAG: hypothetical protein J5855_10440 [Mailhella sp.]|nr:hypothetical protein [Mailhella sp.]
MAVVLGCALVGQGLATDKTFSWDDDSITSAGVAGTSGHGWDKESFNVSVPDTETPSGVNTATDSGSSGLSWGDGMDEPVKSSSGNTETDTGGSSGLSWGDGMDEPVKSSSGNTGTDTGGSSGLSWGDGIDEPVKSSSGNTGTDTGGSSGLSWGDGMDEPVKPSSGNTGTDTGGSSGLSWGDGMDEPVKSSSGNTGTDTGGSSGLSWGDGIDESNPSSGSRLGTEDGLAFLVIDRDSAGTNVRATPSGVKIQVIPLNYPGEMRTVRASGEVSKGWFALMPGGLADDGWVHRSVLGICAGASAKGGARAYLDPDPDGESVQIPAGIPLTPLDMQEGWVKVRLGMGTGTSECWIPKEDLVLSDEELDSCAQTWAER